MKIHMQRDFIISDLEKNNGLDIVDRSSNVDRLKLAQAMLRQGDHQETMRRLMNNTGEQTIRESEPNPFARNNLSLSEKRDMIDKSNKTLYEVNRLKKLRSEALLSEQHNELVRKAAEYDNLQKNVDKSTKKEAS